MVIERGVAVVCLVNKVCLVKMLFYWERYGVVKHVNSMRTILLKHHYTHENYS